MLQIISILPSSHYFLSGPDDDELSVTNVWLVACSNIYCRPFGLLHDGVMHMRHENQYFAF